MPSMTRVALQPTVPSSEYSRRPSALAALSQRSSQFAVPMPWLLAASPRWLLAAGAVFAVGCADDGTTGQNQNANGGVIPGTGSAQPCLGGNTGLDCKAIGEVRNELTKTPVQPTETINIDVGNIQNQGSYSIELSLNNNAPQLTAAGLVIVEARLDYAATSDKEDPEAGSVAFKCVHASGESCEKATAGKKWRTVVPSSFVDEPNGRVSQEKLKIVYTRFDSNDREATLHLKLAGDVTKPAYAIKFRTKQGSPKAKVPGEVTFPLVQPGSSAPEEFAVTNVGDALLLVKALELVGDSTFSLKSKDAAGKDVITPAGKTLSFDPALEIEVGKSAKFIAVFTAKDGTPEVGSVFVKTNDPSAALSGLEVKLKANDKVPCIDIKPVGKVQFGGAVPGSTEKRDVIISGCGSEELRLHSIAFAGAAGDSTEFGIEWGKLLAKCPDIDPKTGPSQAKPCVLKLNESSPLTLTYAPSDVPKDGKPDVASVEFKSNAFVTKVVPVEGVGVLQTCPLAKIEVKEGEEVIPQTELHLKGDQSKGPGGATIKKYKWTVKQPAGSNQPLSPNSAFANPKFLANASGEYEFCLEVWDQNDVKSCVATCLKVLVVPNNAIHVELLWDTPADPDQTDSGPAAGADMDLHFAHQIATGPDIDCDGTGDPWFSNPFDTFWFNPNPNWGSANPSAGDDPSLDLDDTDGAGPENLNLEEPEGDAKLANKYPVGVHYWNDHNFGASNATISIYLQGTLSVQIPKIKMDVLDMWYVGKINWPNVLTGNKEPVFSPCYQSGDVCSGAGKMWKPTGAWCITPCYENKSFTASAGGVAPAKCKKK